MNKFEVLEVLGEGTYGIVVKALQKDTNDIVAIKKFKDNAKHFIKRELKMLNSLKSCEFIVNLKEAYKRKEKVYFIFEYVERSLLNLLQEYQQGLPQNIVKSLVFQLCKAIEKCHSLDIIHRDIKPENLLIDRNYHLKLCDFGFARQTTPDQRDQPYTEYVATRWYRAPELLLFCPYSKPVDIWAIGCLVCEMSNGRPLFAGTSDLDQIHRILSLIGPLPENVEELKRNGKYLNFKLSRYDKNLTFDKKFAEIMSEHLLDFTKGCLILNPKSRMVISECLMHPALELQLKSYVSKKIGKDISTVSSMRMRDKQKMDGRESRNRKAISLTDHQMFHPIQSRLSVNGDLNEINEEPFLVEKLINNLPNNSNLTHHDYTKPKIIESRLKTTTTQFYQSDEDLRTNDDSNHHHLVNKIAGNPATTAAVISTLARKQSLLTSRNYSNKDECFNSNNNVYDASIDVERNRISTSTLSNYANHKSYQDQKNEFTNNNYFKLLKSRNESKINMKRSKSTLVEMIDLRNHRKTPDFEVVNKSNKQAKPANQYLLQLQHLNKLEINNFSDCVEIYAPLRNSNEIFKSPRIANIKKSSSQISHHNRENFLF